ncbi:MAG: aminotransferase class I/II-fold pyridoxal phosphate-dependent enzyme, partial [Nitrospirae bacterium]|nr:aminotransferase class I/II-fold pyridoxal phosphate-dependent enzyme [Candidatus Manganitrophaceae bacterium]
MNEQNIAIFVNQLDEIQKQGLKKEEAAITSAQDAHVIVAGRKILNLCANNYLGLAKHPEIIKAATEALKTHGYGMASVRFICGTQDLHQSLENRISTFLETEETILYSSCFDANTGLFETLFSEEDAIISDTLNHASIIDGIRLCKAKRYRYRHMDMDD